MQAQVKQEGTTTHIWGTPGAPGSGDQEDCVTGPTEYLLYKVTIKKLEDVADLPNAQKQTQRRSQNEEEKMFQMKEQDKTPET